MICDRHDTPESWCADCQMGSTPVLQRVRDKQPLSNGIRGEKKDLLAATPENVNAFVVKHSADYYGNIARLPLDERAAQAFASWTCSMTMARAMRHFLYVEDNTVVWVGLITGVVTFAEEETGRGPRMGYSVEPDDDTRLLRTTVYTNARLGWGYAWVEDGQLLDRKP